MTAPVLYEKPELLSSEAHRQKRLQVFKDFSRTAGMHAALLTVGEFAACAPVCPVIFVSNPEEPGAADTARPDATAAGSVSPVALLGLKPGQNLLVEGDRWTGEYIPAFIRRYPFMSAQRPGESEVSVVVDTAWPGFSDTEGEPLFNAQGQAAPALDNALNFLRQFDAEAHRTRLFCELLQKHKLLEPMNANITLPQGEALTVDGFWVVHEERLAQLSDEAALELFRSGALGLIHAHLMSLASMQRLVGRLAERLNPPAPAPVA